MSAAEKLFPGQPPGVIVAGMHRSSTSLIASLFETAGYWLPDDQLPAADDNPKGYWEDRRMHLLHRAMLEAYDTAWGFAPRLRKLRRRDLTVPEDLKDEAAALVAMYAEHVPWIWKNPRATLFLEEWARWFPNATFVICVRRPDAVVDSMLRRGNRFRVSGYSWPRRLQRLSRALSVWYSYNLMALRFAKRHPDRAVIVRIPEDLPRLDAASGPQQMEPAMLRAPRRQVRIPLLFAVRARLLHRRLARRADPAAAEALLSPMLLQGPAGDVGAAMVSHVVGIAATTTASLLLIAQTVSS